MLDPLVVIEDPVLVVDDAQRPDPEVPHPRLTDRGIEAQTDGPRRATVNVPNPAAQNSLDNKTGRPSMP